MYLIGASLVSDWSKPKCLPSHIKDLLLYPERFIFVDQSEEVIDPDLEYDSDESGVDYIVSDSENESSDESLDSDIEVNQEEIEAMEVE